MTPTAFTVKGYTAGKDYSPGKDKPQDIAVDAEFLKNWHVCTCSSCYDDTKCCQVKISPDNKSIGTVNDKPCRNAEAKKCTCKIFVYYNATPPEFQANKQWQADNLKHWINVPAADADLRRDAYHTVLCAVPDPK